MRPGRVTVATNLAGRGVDIKLGGALATVESRALVVEKGGLAVIGTERHDARRIDNQLRGRSGRQGDPGETRFFVSLEDKLMRVFASETLKRVMGGFGLPEDEPIESGMITKSLESAQERIEGFNFDSRKQVLAYDDVMNTQRLSIYARRRRALLGTNEEVVEEARTLLRGENTEVRLPYQVGKSDFRTILEAKQAELGEQFIPLLRRLILQVIDTFWLEHLDTMEYLRRSVSLRAYGQRDPLIEYRREGLQRFRAMEEGIARMFGETLPNLTLAQDAAIKQEEARLRAQLEKAGSASLSPAGGKESAVGAAHAPIVNATGHGRNDVVTVKKGTETQTIKYKKAEALLAEGWELMP